MTASTRNAPSIAAMKALVSKLSDFDTIIIHPDNFDRVLGEFVSVAGADTLRSLSGIDVQTNEHLPKFTKRWVPPRGPFWEMEPSDEGWAAKLGFGHYEDTDEPYILMLNMRRFNELFIAPLRMPTLFCF